jgi:SAM-dependent methyltransferase
VLDLGCGTGHSFRELDPRVTVGVDREPRVLEGQERETHVADMRDLPFPDDSFASVIAVQSLEHVPDAVPVFKEVVRVLGAGGRAVFVTPNRLTFGRPHEVIDPYHYVEYDPDELRSICRRFFSSVQVMGLHGSERYLSIVDSERRELDRLLALDPFRLRRLLRRRMRQRLYDWQLRRHRRHTRPGSLEIAPDDFALSEQRLGKALDLVAVCDVSPR